MVQATVDLWERFVCVAGLEAFESQFVDKFRAIAGVLALIHWENTETARGSARVFDFPFTAE